MCFSPIVKVSMSPYFHAQSQSFHQGYTLNSSISLERSDYGINRTRYIINPEVISKNLKWKKFKELNLSTKHEKFSIYRRNIKM